MSGFRLDFAKLHMDAVERHHRCLDSIVQRIADGGTTRDVVLVVIDWLDGMDALTDTDEGPLRAAWIAAGGSDDDYPVVELIFPEPSPGSLGEPMEGESE